MDANAWLKGLADHVDPITAFKKVIGADPDDWQRELLTSEDDFCSVLASRGTGKSMTTAIKGYHFADTNPNSTVVIIAPAKRQSDEIYRYCGIARDNLPLSVDHDREVQDMLELKNNSRLIVLPGSNPETVRGYRAHLIIADEAARLRDDVIAAIIPMLVDGGRIIMLTTPAGRQGFFYEAWQDRRGRQIVARSLDIPRMANIVKRDKAIMSKSAFRSEHMLEWSGSGDAYFDIDLIQQAFVDYPALPLQCMPKAA